MRLCFYVFAVIIELLNLCAMAGGEDWQSKFELSEARRQKLGDALVSYIYA